jgi:hypothetical protein
VALTAALALAQSEPTAFIAVVGATAGVRGDGPQPFADRGSDLRFSVAPGACELHFAATAQGKPASLPLTLAAGAEATVAVAVPPDPDLLFADDFAVPRPLAIHGDDAASASQWHIGSGSLWREAAAAAGRSSAIFGNPDWTDVAVSARGGAFGRDGSFGVLFWRLDERNLGLFEWTSAGRTLTQVLDGVATVLVRDDVPFALARYYQIAIGCRGDAVRVVIDRAEVMAATARPGHGAVGLLASGKARIAFDDLEVRRLRATGERLHGGVGFELPRLDDWTAAMVPAGGDARAAWQTSGGELHKAPGSGVGWTALATGDAGQLAQRVEVDLRAGTGPCGIVLRWQGPDHHYRCVFDPVASEVRCERLLGGQLFVLGKCSVPRARQDEWHHLSAQADGFRIAAWFDQAPMVQTFDGAHTHGQGGVWAAATSTAVFARFAVGAPVPPLDGIAVVRTVGEGGVEVQVTARSPQHAGIDYVLALRLPQWRVARLVDGNGIEPFLLLGDADGVLPMGFADGGKWDGVRGSIGPAGEIAAHLQWPVRRALSGRYLQISGCVISPDGEQCIDWLPAVWLQL